MSIKQYLTFAAMVAAIGIAGETAFNGVPKDNSPKNPTSGRYNLPLWDFEGQSVYARNEKEAVKRAKKRGYWREGMTYKQIG